MGVCFHRGPTFGEPGGALHSKAFLFREIFMRFSRQMQMPQKRVSLSIGPCWETWRGFVCRGFWEKRKHISGFLSWTQRTLRF